MIIPVASDHAGFQIKETVKKILKRRHIQTRDFGTTSEEPVDYPDFGSILANEINRGNYEQGILICGSGQGMCITANKYPKVRAALAWSPEIAALSRKHNQANILCLPGRFLGEHEVEEILKAWLESPFEGGRHERRVNKLSNLIKKIDETP